MSGSKTPVKLKSEELFDKLLEESKKNLELSKNKHKKFVEEPLSKRSGSQNETPQKASSPSAERNLEVSSEDTTSSIRKTVNPSPEMGSPNSEFADPQETPVQAFNKIAENSLSPSPKKTLNQSDETGTSLPETILDSKNKNTVCKSGESIFSSQEDDIISSPMERGTMTEPLLLGKDAPCSINKNVCNLPSAIPISDSKLDLSSAPVIDEAKQGTVWNLDDEHTVHSYTLSDVQCLDQAVENIIIAENDKVILGNCENMNSESSFKTGLSDNNQDILCQLKNVLGDTYFKKGSHFGVKLSSLNAGNCAESGLPHSSRKRGEIDGSINQSETSANCDSSMDTSFEDIFTKKRTPAEEVKEFNNFTSTSNKPVFSSPKTAYPDIYLHKDKINILRQMSQVFNNEKCQDIVETIKNPTSNEILDNAGVIDQSNANDVMVNKDILDKSTQNESCSSGSIEEMSPKVPQVSDIKHIEDNISVPVHLVSSTKNDNEKQTKVKSFTGENGECIDVIDGFAFVSFDSVDKLSQYKDKSKKFSGKFHRSKIRKKRRILLNKRRLKKLHVAAKGNEGFDSVNQDAADTPQEIATDTSAVKQNRIYNFEKHSHIGQIGKNRPSSTSNHDTKDIKPDCFKIINPTKFKCQRKPNIKRVAANVTGDAKNEILYLYFGGNLLTLAGSISKISPTNTGPLKGRVVLPDGLDYIDLKKREALREVSPIEINKDLAAFALSALKSPEQLLATVQKDVTVKENITPNILSIVENSDESLSQNGFKTKYESSNCADFKEKAKISPNMVQSSINEDLTINNSENSSELSSSKIKWTQADVIKSTAGSQINDKSSGSKKNIHRFPSLSREMKRLNMNFISYNNDILEEVAKEVDEEDICWNEAFCKLGCICASLKCRKIAQNHCGRVGCMLKCSCLIGNLGEGTTRISRANSVSILNLDKEHQNGLATKEKEFKKTVVQSGSDIFLVERDKKKRDIKLPERYGDSFSVTTPEDSSILLFEKAKSSPDSYIAPEDYGKYTKKFHVDIPWYQLPDSVSVWCMFHKRYDCKCLFDPKHSLKMEHSSDSLSSISSDECSDNENDVKESFEIGTQSSAIICQKLVRHNQSSVLENDQTYTFKYWIHNGEHHSARSCGYEMKNMRFEAIQKMPYHYPEPARPLIMGMTAKVSNYIPARIKNSFKVPNQSLTIKSDATLRKADSQIQLIPSTSGSNNFPGTVTGIEAIPGGSGSAKQPIQNLQRHTQNSKNSENIRDSVVSLNWMILEEERRGELELDLSVNTPGRNIIVSEPRFKKLINMSIVGIVGLSSNRRCIISTVKSTEDLVKMQKIHHLIMNNTVDVGPNMKEIFFTQSSNKNRYVMIRCDSIGRWEIFGVVQKKKSETDSSPPSKRDSAVKRGTDAIFGEAVKTNDMSAVEGHPDPVCNSKDKFVLNDSEALNTEKYVNEIHNEEEGIPLITDVVSVKDPSSVITGDYISSGEAEVPEEVSPLVTSDVPKKTISFILNGRTKGPIQGINLASLLPNESRFTVKTIPRLNEGVGKLLQVSKTSEKKTFLWSPIESNKKEMTSIPVEKGAPIILSLLSSSPSTGLPSLSSKTLKDSHSTTNECFFDTSKKRKFFKSSTLSVKNSHHYFSSPLKKTKTGLPLGSSSIAETQCDKAFKFAPKCVTASSSSNIGMSESTESYFFQSPNKLLSSDKDVELLEDTRRIKDANPSHLRRKPASSDDKIKLRKVNSCEDFSLRLESSSEETDSADDANDQENENITSPIPNVKVAKDKGKNPPCSLITQQPGQPKKVATLKITQSNDDSGDELEIISSQKRAQCCCIDMFIQFVSVRLPWLVGVMAKSVLVKIAVESRMKRVPISLIVEMSGVMIKFFGLYQNMSECNLPVLILGSTLSEVREKALQGNFFQHNPVRYNIKHNDNHIFVFKYDKTGQNLVLQNTVRSKGVAVQCKQMTTPVTALRKYENLYNSRFVTKRSVDVPKSLHVATRANKPTIAPVRKRSVVPLLVCKPGGDNTFKPVVSKQRNRKFSFACKSPAKSLAIPQIPIKRKYTSSSFAIGNSSKKAKVCADIGVTAHLGKHDGEQSSVDYLGLARNIDLKCAKRSANIDDDISRTDIVEVPSKLCDVNPSSLLDSGHNKAFGIACYDDMTLKDTSGQHSNKSDLEPMLKPSSEDGSLDSPTSSLKSYRKQSLKRANLREFDSGSETFEDTSLSSINDVKSPIKKSNRRVQREAEQHNMKEKLRRKAQSVLFHFLLSRISEGSSPVYRECGLKMSKGGILCDAIGIIKTEEFKSCELVTKEHELRKTQSQLLSKLSALLSMAPKNVRKKVSDQIKNQIVHLSAKEDFILCYKAKPLEFDNGNIRVKEDGNLAFYHGSQPLVD